MFWNVFQFDHVKRIQFSNHFSTSFNNSFISAKVELTLEWNMLGCKGLEYTFRTVVVWMIMDFRLPRYGAGSGTILAFQNFGFGNIENIFRNNTIILIESSSMGSNVATLIEKPFSEREIIAH